MKRRLVGLLALLMLAGCLSAEERKQRAEARAREDAEKADAAVTALLNIAAALPKKKEALAAKACPAALAERSIYYSPVDAEFFEQFTPDGFVAKESKRRYRKFFAQERDFTGNWYRTSHYSELSALLKKMPRKDAKVARHYHAIVWNGGGDLNRQPQGYVAVVYRKDEQLPAISNYPGKGEVELSPAAFDGWVVLVEPSSAKVLCQARFHAANSSSLTFRAGNDPLAVAFEDFENQFALAIEDSLREQGAPMQHFAAW